MGWQSYITTTLLGRRLGLQQLSTTNSGTGQSGRVPEFLVGAEDIRKEVTTGDSTATYLKAYAFSVIERCHFAGNKDGLTRTVLVVDAWTNAGGRCLANVAKVSDTPVYRLDPPIPGVTKCITFQSTTIGTLTAKINVTCSTGGGAGIQTSNGSSFTVFGTSAGAFIRLVGVTTALWATDATTGQGFTFSTST